jgi:hypothetical protein
LHGLGADGNALLSFQLFPDLCSLETGVGNAVAEFTAAAAADDLEPATNDSEAQGCQRAQGGRFLSGHGLAVRVAWRPLVP